MIVRATDDDNYLLAPESGLWETFVDLGDRVEPGQLVGRIHFIERPDREPRRGRHRATAASSASSARSPPTDQGDNVVVIGREIDESRSCM